MSAPILTVQDLRREFVTRKPLFGEATVVKAVDGVNLRINAGETFAIVGESGCGKSTLARLMVRLIGPTSGEVHFDGANIADLPDDEMRSLRRDLQFIFQDPFSSLNPRMTVGALIEEPLRAHEIGDALSRKARVDELLRQVGLTPSHASRYPHEFSGGQRQRIGIARALATGPKIIIGDEPVSALDVSIQAQVVNILEDLKEAYGLTLIIIAHDLAVIRHMADRVAVMYLGEIVEVAETETLFCAPKHPYTETLLAAIPIASVGARRARTPAEGDPPNPINPPPGCKFHTRCPYAQARCAIERPVVQAVAVDHQAACHLSSDLTLTGLTEATPQRSAAAQARFDLFRAASATRHLTSRKSNGDKI